jgi:uncharacterized protein YqgV (UPF0045/DUF77 family)
MAKELTAEEAIFQAIKEVEEAMLENIRASQLVLDVTKRKEKARYTLLKAKERLNSLERSLM